MKKGLCKLAPNEVHKGDKIKNTNPECKHYKSKGVVTKVSKIKGKKGNIVGNKVQYKATNDGKHWKKGDKLEKTEIQLNKENFKPFRYFFEKHCPDTVGVVEKVYIDGLGNVDAKIDSGNDSNNVLCGTNIEIVEKEGHKYAKFTSVNDKELTRPLLDLVSIHIGAGEQEKRPLVALDIVFGNNLYKMVPFSIGDRTENDQPVLIGKKFLQQLGMVIDVTKEYLLPAYDEKGGRFNEKPFLNYVQNPPSHVGGGNTVGRDVA
jgi:hypothetical protein